MGEATSGPIQLSFNPQLRVEFRGATVTSDARLLLPRALEWAHDQVVAALKGQLKASG